MLVVSNLLLAGSCHKLSFQFAVNKLVNLSPRAKIELARIFIDAVISFPLFFPSLKRNFPRAAQKGNTVGGG